MIFKEGRVKSATLLNWKNYFEWYMEPYDIVEIPMRDLKRSQFVAHFKFLAEKKGLAEGTLRAIASMIHNCLQQVVYDSGLFVNPASEITKREEKYQQYVRGWINYFKLADMKHLLKETDEWARRRIRAVYWKQC